MTFKVNKHWTMQWIMQWENLENHRKKMKIWHKGFSKEETQSQPGFSLWMTTIQECQTSS